MHCAQCARARRERVSSTLDASERFGASDGLVLHGSAVSAQELTALQRAAADSAARAALSVESLLTWRYALAATFVLGAFVALFVFFAEYREIKAAGGIKKYTSDMNTVNYGAYRGVTFSEIVAGAVGMCIVLRAIVPDLVSDLQVEAVAILFSFVGLFRGINFFAFRSKLTNADPAVIAANAAAAHNDVMPVVTKNAQTGVTTVDVVPTPKAEAEATIARASAQEKLEDRSESQWVVQPRAKSAAPASDETLQPLVRDD